MPAAPRKSSLVKYPPLSPELKVRMRKAGHGDMIDVLDKVSADTIRGLMRAAQSGPVFRPKGAKKDA